MKMSPFAHEIMVQRYAKHPDETWPEIAERVVGAVFSGGCTDHLITTGPRRPFDQYLSCHDRLVQAVIDRKFIPGGRYLYASGRPYHQTQNCLLLRAQDTREGWGETMQHVTLALMTGAGLGVNYSKLRAEGSKLGAAGGTSSGPIALMQMVNEVARGARQGGARRGAIWAGLAWNHPDAYKFIHVKDWPEEVVRMKERDFNFPAKLDHTNISITLDDDFFLAYHCADHVDHVRAQDIYWAVIQQMCKTGEPGFSVDVGENAGEDLRNACTEITTCDDSDICNIGSINLARVESVEEMRELVELGTLFLLAGSVYSDVPYDKVAKVRTRNRRLGLGLMGIHEFLLQRGQPYGSSVDLAEYLRIYQDSDHYADKWAGILGLSAPLKTRAIAPNGTIGIIGETTTSAEPIFCAAYKRRYRDGEVWKSQYVIDPTAARLVAQGMDPNAIEDAYTLAEDVERRVSFQAWLQSYVDHGISSTINLPPWGTKHNNVETLRSFGDMLMRYLPKLRGITTYPDGARDGQPLTRVPYAEAAQHVGEVFIENADTCEITRGGSCG